MLGKCNACGKTAERLIDHHWYEWDGNSLIELHKDICWWCNYYLTRKTIKKYGYDCPEPPIFISNISKIHNHLLPTWDTQIKVINSCHSEKEILLNAKAKVTLRVRKIGREKRSTFNVTELSSTLSNSNKDNNSETQIKNEHKNLSLSEWYDEIRQILQASELRCVTAGIQVCQLL